MRVQLRVYLWKVLENVKLPKPDQWLRLGDKDGKEKKASIARSAEKHLR